MGNNVFKLNQIIEQQNRITKMMRGSINNTVYQKMQESRNLLTQSYTKALVDYAKVMTNFPIQQMHENISYMYKVALDNSRHYEAMAYAMKQSILQSSEQALKISKAIRETYNIQMPYIPEETQNRWRFIKIASQLDFPIYFEIDTELQDNILEICEGITDVEKYPVDRIKQIIFWYFDELRIKNMSDYWLEEKWIDERRKRHLLQAIELHNKGYYSGSTSILMCQLGGLIDDLYTKTETDLPAENYSRLLKKYNITKLNGDKAKVLRMMAAQTSQVALWYYSADYFMNYTYSSSKDIEYFTGQPGRNKICHGEQLDFDTKEYSLKAILITDILILLGMDIIRSDEYAV